MSHDARYFNSPARTRHRKVATQRALAARDTTNPISRQLAKYNRIALIRFASDIMGETPNLQTCRYSAGFGLCYTQTGFGRVVSVCKTGM